MAHPPQQWRRTLRGYYSNSWYAQNKKGTMITHDAFNVTTKFVVGRAGFEPATNGLKVRCSTS